MIVDECTETIEEVKIAKRNLAENENKNKNKNAVLALWILCYFGYFFTINVGRIGAYFIYFCGYLKRLFTHETTIC